MPTGSDASYTPERFLARYDELANVLGNLASRVIAMIDKYRGGVVPEARADHLADRIAATLDSARRSMAGYHVHEALAAAMELARDANGWVEGRQPWAQAKSPATATDLDETLATLARTLVVLAALFQPVAPAKMADLSSRLGLARVPTLAEAESVRLAGRRVRKDAPLFPKVEATET
jgi:methionyl-tRNA synthetase